MFPCILLTRYKVLTSNGSTLWSQNVTGATRKFIITNTVSDVTVQCNDLLKVEKTSTDLDEIPPVTFKAKIRSNGD